MLLFCPIIHLINDVTVTISFAIFRISQCPERERLVVINQVRSQLARHNNRAGNCQLTTTNKTQYSECSELKIQSGKHGEGGDKKGTHETNRH